MADEAVAASFTAPGDPLRRMMYGWSITHCLPVSLAEQPSAAIGTAIRLSTVRELAAAAGFADVEVLDVDGASSAFTPCGAEAGPAAGGDRCATRRPRTAGPLQGGPGTVRP